MRVSKIRWVSHSKSTILSVDVQPSGYRFITGGADAYVRIWNLMPVVSYDHEMEGEEDEEDQEGEEDSQVIAGADEAGGGAGASDGARAQASSKRSGGGTIQKRQSGVSSHHKEDSKMRGNDSDNPDSNGEESDDGLTPEERLKRELIDKEYEKDTKLMESLFPDEPSKSKRLLATLEGHQAPINCVRWNNLGTIFASADDEGTINLWQYRGKTVLSAY